MPAWWAASSARGRISSSDGNMPGGECKPAAGVQTMTTSATSRLRRLPSAPHGSVSIGLRRRCEDRSVASDQTNTGEILGLTYCITTMHHTLFRSGGWWRSLISLRRTRRRRPLSQMTLPGGSTTSVPRSEGMGFATGQALRVRCDFRVTLCCKSAIVLRSGFTTIVSTVTSRPFRTGLEVCRYWGLMIRAGKRARA